MLDSIPDVRLVKLQPHLDSRGAFTELYRNQWETGIRPEQWNADHSVARTVRGVHAHTRRVDYVSVLWGSLVLALHDTRRSSPMFGRTVTAEFHRHDGLAIIIPPRVAHGFYYLEDSVIIIGFSDRWDPSDDFRCHHAAPELGISWPGPVDHISKSDQAAPSYRRFLDGLGEL